MRIGTAFAGIALLVATPALAQDQPGGSGGNTGTMDRDTGGTGSSNKWNRDTGGSAQHPMGTMEPGQPLAKADRDFLEKAAGGGMFEVQAGQMALQKAQSQQVKSFAQRMVDDHGKVNQQLQQIAEAKGITLPTQLPGDEQKKLDQLTKMTGADFDKAYMKEMVDDHAKDVSDYQKIARDSKDPQIKSFAAQTLPTLKQHSDMAKRDRRML